MELKINKCNPINKGEWNQLAESNSNLLASSIYDPILMFYHQDAIYFQVFENNILVAGVKLYIYESKKIPFFLPKISRGLIQFGECIVQDENKLLVSKYLDFLNLEIKNFIHQKAIVWLRVDGFYGKNELLINPFLFKNQDKYAVSWVDLTQSEELLYQNLHPHHKRALKKANKNNLIFEEINDYSIFEHILTETYNVQNIKPPNLNFLRKSYQVLNQFDKVKLFAVKREDTYYSVALVSIYGKKAYYNFGGNLMNNWNTGHFLHWNIMKELKSENMDAYSFGQTAYGINPDNLKFSKGITEFKLRFFTIQEPSFSYLQVFKPFNYRIFNILKKLIRNGS